MEIFKEIGDLYEDKLTSVSNFKIGKTGQKIEDRYSKEYDGEYEKYQSFGTSPDKLIVEKFEKYLVERFIDLDNCDNEEIVEGELAESDNYVVYLVYNN